MSAGPSVAVDWDITLQTIQEEKCVLFLGPDLFTRPDGKRLEQQLTEYLDVDNNPDILKYYQEEDLFLFSSKAAKTKTYYKLKAFFQQEFPHVEALFEKIAQIPFHFIITVTSDQKLQSVFEQLHLKSKSDFYWKNYSPTTKTKIPARDNPLIYNIFGSVERQESMVLTHNDLFDYFSSVLGERSIPKELKHCFNDAHNFIFLGIPFDKWYLQLLLRMLSLHDDSEFMRFAANQAVDPELASLCLQHFRIEFLPTKADVFIEELYNHCQQAGILRKAPENRTSIIDQLKELLAQDKMNKVFEQLREFFEQLGDLGADFLDDVLLLKNRHRRLMKRIAQGIIDNNDSNLESNKIRKSLMELLNEAKTLE